MARKSEVIAEVQGHRYVTVSGAVVHMNLNNSVKAVGEVVVYAPIKSTKNIRVQAGSTQWIESKSIGPVFNKEVSTS